jgi:GAF domain-containing protein
MLGPVFHRYRDAHRFAKLACDLCREARLYRLPCEGSVLDGKGNEGLAHEVAARFYNARGFETIAQAYLRNARYCYLRWGANGKVRQLDRLYPQLTAPEGHRPTTTIGSPVQQIDVASVVKASQAVSSEIVLPKLIEQLMQICFGTRMRGTFEFLSLTYSTIFCRTSKRGR